MHADVVLLPIDLRPGCLRERAVVVFDVLRATTSMTAALAAGVSEIRIFPNTAAAFAAREAFQGESLLCGEEKALPPPGFDLGNSPGDFRTALHRGRTMFISTTNGTRAILACSEARAVYIGALVNAAAVAKAIVHGGLDVTLLCAGTNGKVAMEDLLGAGAVLAALAHVTTITFGSDNAEIAARLFTASKNDLPQVLRQTQGGKNVIAAGLEPDIDFAATLDRFTLVGEVIGQPPVVRLAESAL